MILSDRDIRRELGKNILIHPLNPSRIKGASINLTASRLAWSLKTKKTIYDATTDCITIPPNDTALIETEESIYVTNKIAGSYHSKVKLASLGLGHIGTTLDPGWLGSSLIALHNTTDSEIRITRGDSIVSILLYYTKTKSTTNRHEDHSSRLDVLNSLGISLTREESKWVENKWRNDPEALKQLLKKDQVFIDLKSAHETVKNTLTSGTAGYIYFLICCIAIYFSFEFTSLKQTLSLTTKELLIPLISTPLAVLGTLLITKSK